jgi:hypothetical protein
LTEASQPGDLPSRIGKYEIVSRVGRGAMGVVYHARDPMLERDVALKVMLPQIAGDPDQKGRFEREARAVAKIVHPNVLTVFDLGYHHDGSPYIAMELLKGQDLLHILRNGWALALERKVDIVVQLLDGLACAHHAGIVHRDVKPANIFLTVDGTVKIMDFGVARFTMSSTTGTGAVMGTADYMSPEQAKGVEVDARADVYALGCVLFECLAGVRPFDRETELSVVFAHLNESPPRLSDVRPELPHAFDDVVATALAKTPDERYATCGELVEAARAALRGERSPRRLRSRRRRYVLVAAVLLAAAAAVAGVLATRDSPASPPPVSITQSSIAGARLGLTQAAYKDLYGVGWRADVVTQPNFPVLIYQHRREAIYFDPDTRRGIIVTTWNPEHRTAAGIGPCSTIEEAKSTYGSAFKPSRWNTIDGKVYAYLVGKNLLFAANGLPPNPSKLVTAVALYDGDGPRDDGSGVEEQGGTLPFAGFIALSESTCG